MKRKFIFSLALSAAMLSACNGNTVQDPSSADGEGSCTTGSYQQHFSESLAERGNEEASGTEEPADEAELETTAPEETEADAAETDSVPLDALWRYMDIDFSGRDVLIGDNLICTSKSHETDTDLVWQHDLNFYDIKENRVVKTVSLPEGFDVDDICPGSGNVLARILNNSYDHRVKAIVTSAAVIYDDYSFDIIDEPTAKDFYFEHYGHKISEWDIDLVCVDGEPEVIVPGYRKENDEYGFYTEYKVYMFPIDENRFVYRTGGYERLPGFGIYDFGTGTARDIPDSKDLVPIGGVHDGKVYSVKTAWDGIGGTELYVTDIETLETSLFMTFPYELQLNDFVNYYMPASGKYILALRDGYQVDNIMYLIDPDTGEIIKTYDDIPQDFYFYGSKLFLDEYTIAFSGTLDGEDKMLVFSLQ